MIIKNTASQNIPLGRLVSATDGTEITSAATAHVSIDGAASASGSGTLTYRADAGWWYAPTQAETNGNAMIFSAAHADAVGGGVSVGVITVDHPRTAIPAAAAGASGGLPTVDGSNYVAGVQGTLNTLDALDAAQDSQHATTQGKVDVVDAIVDDILLDTGTDGVVVAAGSKAGYALAADGLDSVSTTAPAAVASNFREMVVQTWRRFFKRGTMTSTEMKTYADDDATVLTTQTLSDNGTTQEQGPAS